LTGGIIKTPESSVKYKLNLSPRAFKVQPADLNRAGLNWERFDLVCRLIILVPSSISTSTSDISAEQQATQWRFLSSEKTLAACIGISVFSRFDCQPGGFALAGSNRGSSGAGKVGA
jgi:hypothetical protein